MQMIHRYMCAWMNLSMYVLPWTEMMPSWVLSRYGQRTGRALVCNRCQHAKEHGRFGRRQWGTFLWRRDFYVCEKGRWAKKSWETLPGTSSDLPIPPQTDEREAIFFTEEHDVHCSHRGILCPGQRFRSSHPILVLSGWAPIPHPMNCLEPAKPAKLLEYHRWQGSNHTIIQFPVAPCMLGGTSPEPQHLRARVVLKSLSANLCYRLYFPPTDLREDCCGPAGCFQREAPFLHASCLALFPAARTAVLTLQI